MKIRIGKELHISWSILTQGENKPLEGRDLRLYLQDPNLRRRALEFTTDANTLLVVIPAKTLTSIGRYALILTENEGQEGQTAVDANPAFTLVETSREEDTNTTEAPNLDVATINLATGNLTLRMVLQELFDGKDGGDMKTGDILAVLRDGELHRVSAKIGTGTGTGADCSAEIEALTAKVEENTANIAGATTAASNALKTAQSAQTAASSASQNAGQAQELANEALKKATEAAGKADAAKTVATEAKRSADSAAGKADTAIHMLRFSSIIYDANIEEQEDAPISPDFLIVFVRGKGLFVASDGGKYYKVFTGSDDYNTTLEGITKARQDRLFFIKSLEENRYYHYDGVDLRHLTTSEPEIAGRVWNEDNATPKAESYYGSLKALRDLPKRLGLGRYLVTDVFDEDGNIVTDEKGSHKKLKKKLDPNDSTKYLDGSPAKLDGSEGQCMWCWNGFYANIWHEGSRLIKAVTFDGPVGGETSVWIPAGGTSWLGAGVMDRTNNILCSVINDSEQFRGGTGVALDKDTYTTPPDNSPQITMLCMPATNITTRQFGDAARNRFDKNGNVIKGWEANWFVARFVVEFLFEVIMGTENSQEEFSEVRDANGLYQGGFNYGMTGMKNWANYNGGNPLIPTSVGLEAGDDVCLVPYSLPQTGEAEGAFHTFNVPVFFGLVGAGFGNLFKGERGIIIDNTSGKTLVYITPSMYATYKDNSIKDKLLVAECPNNSGWITKISYRGLCNMPIKLGGSSSSRYADNYYTNPNDKALHINFIGGDAGDYYKNQAGIFNIDSRSTSILAVKSNTAPLCYFEEDPIIPESEKIEI